MLGKSREVPPHAATWGQQTWKPSMQTAPSRCPSHSACESAVFIHDPASGVPPTAATREKTFIPSSQKALPTGPSPRSHLSQHHLPRLSLLPSSCLPSVLVLAVPIPEPSPTIPAISTQVSFDFHTSQARPGQPLTLFSALSFLLLVKS